MVQTQQPPQWRLFLGRIPKILVFLVLIFWFLVELYPIVFMFITSLKTDKQILNAPFAFPDPIQSNNYVQVWIGDRANQPYISFLTNSVIVTVGTLILLIFVASLAGYALARGKFPGRSSVQQAFLLTLAVPVHVLLIPIYFFMGRLGLRNNLIGMMIVYATLGLPFTIILMRAYFLSFPRELEEQAMIDGCSRFGTFLRIVIPVSRGTLASVAIVNITWVWSELFFALVLLNKEEVRTLPLAISAYKPAAMAAEAVVGQQFAIMSLTTLPLIIFYFMFQRHIRKGMTAGALR